MCNDFCLREACGRPEPGGLYVCDQVSCKGLSNCGLLAELSWDLRKPWVSFLSVPQAEGFFHSHLKPVSAFQVGGWLTVSSAPQQESFFGCFALPCFALMGMVLRLLSFW